MTDVFREGSPLDKRRSQESLTDFDRKVFESMSKAMWLPDEFKDYMVQYQALNQLPISAGQIPGLYRNVPRSLAKSSNIVDVVSTTAETAIFSELVPGGAMGAEGALRISIDSDYLSNSGAPADFTVRLKWGGSTIIGNLETTSLTTAVRHGMRLEFYLRNLGSQSSNQAFGRLEMSYPQALSVAGFGDNSANSLPTRKWFSAVQSVDTGAQQTVEVSVQHSTSSASVSWRRQAYSLEVIG